MKRSSLLLAPVLLSSISFAQTPTTPAIPPGVAALRAQIGANPNLAHLRDRCGTPPRSKDAGSSFSGVASDCSIFSTNPAAAYAPTTAVFDIPVVVHVIQNTNGQGFLSVAQIQSQIDILNEDFGALAGSNGANGNESLIQFHLATTDPQGNATSGITYSTNSNWWNDNGNYWSSLAWNTNQYMNIYTNLNPGVLGYVPDLPQGGGLVGSSADRIVVAYDTFGNFASGGAPYNRGRTTTHEVGHYLGLFHTFDSGCGSASCYSTGDTICDTNSESVEHFGCSTSSSCGTSDPIRNYMNYTDDLCMWEFTPEQIRRMRCTLINWRPNLATVTMPTACNEIDSFEPNDACGSAASVVPGTQNGLFVQASDEDWYSIDVAPGQMLDVDVNFTHATGDLGLFLFESCGGSIVANSSSSTNNEGASVMNNTGSTINYKIRVFVALSSPQTCNDYSLTIAVTGAAPCEMPDALDPNDSCAAADAVGTGTINNLRVSKTDEDWYTIDLLNNQQLDFDITFSHANGDLGLIATQGCGGAIVGNSSTMTSNESITVVNTTGSTQSYKVRVSVALSSPQDCNDYSLTVAVTGTGPAPCEAADVLEPNDSCGTADVMTPGTQNGLTVQKTNEDWYSVDVGNGQTLDVDVLFTHANGDLVLFVTEGCGGPIAGTSSTSTNNESLSITNNTGSTLSYKIRVTVALSSPQDCNDYSLAIAVSGGPSPCEVPDVLEPNDVCSSANPIVPGLINQLTVQETSEDWYSIDVQNGQSLDVDLNFTHANGDLGLIVTEGCGGAVVANSSTTTNNENASLTNNTGVTQSYKIRVSVSLASAQSCNDYTLFTDVTGIGTPTCATPDALEPNTACGNAVTIGAGSMTGLTVQKTDEDWYSIDVAPGETLNADIAFAHANGDLGLQILEACGGVILANSQSTTDDESASALNNTGSTETYKIRVVVTLSSAQDCNDYDLTVSIDPPAPSGFTSFCFGDGFGTLCPCGNESDPGYLGGCANSVGNGAILSGTGSASVMNDTLEFNVTSATPSSFGALVSGNNALGGGNGILGMAALDGLRCVGGGFLRHGSRALDGNGANTNPWGGSGGPPVGLIAASSFGAGQTRHFQVFYRELETVGCLTGQNTSNAVTVPIVP